MSQMRRQKQDCPLAQLDSFPLAAIDDIEIGIALELPEELFERIVVKISTLVRSTHDGDDEIGVLPDLLIADRWLEQMGLFG
jgi:hypothetical protein